MNTELFCILDMSGSMQHLKQDTIGGYNQFVTEQRDVPGEARLTTVLFNHRVDAILKHADIRTVTGMSSDQYSPGGSTALLDALGRTLSSARARIKAEGWSEKNIVLVITDGAENASMEWTQSGVKSLIEELEKEGWSFIYQGANQDSFSVAWGLGMARSVQAGLAKNYQANAVGTAQAYSDMSLSTRNLRTP